MGKWEMVRLGDVITVTSGGTPSRANGKNWIGSVGSDLIPWVKTGDLKSMYLSEIEESITTTGLQNSSAKIFPVDTLLVAMYGATIGACSILSVPASTNQACAALLPTNKYSSSFLFYYFLNIKQKLISLGVGGAQPNISGNIIKSLKIPLPPLLIQKKIADVLDRARALIEKRKAQIAKLDLLIKSQFIEMFSEYYANNTTHKKLKEVCNFIDYRGKTPKKSESGIPLITAKNVKENIFSIEPQEFIPYENYDAVMTRGIPKYNDILFTTEAPLGNVCRIPRMYDKFCVGQRIVTMQPKVDVLVSEYLERALLYHDFQSQIAQKSTGSTVVGIRSKELIELTLPLPPLSLQNSFADFVCAAEKSKFEMQRGLDKLELLYKSLMQRCFYGEMFA